MIIDVTCPWMLALHHKIGGGKDWTKSGTDNNNEKSTLCSSP